MKTRHNKSAILILAVVFTISIWFMIPAQALAADSKPVTVDNFVRAESDTMIRANMKAFDVAFGKFSHLRKPTTPENQPVIRMYQDTLYSGTVLDLSNPVTITLPEIGGRYMSMHVAA